MGLLDHAMGAQTQAPQMGGLLGAGAPAGPAQGGRELQMAQQLAQNPTPQMAQQIIQQMRQSGMEGADEIAQVLMQAGDDPQTIKQIADAAVQALSGQ